MESTQTMSGLRMRGRRESLPGSMHMSKGGQEGHGEGRHGAGSHSRGEDRRGGESRSPFRGSRGGGFGRGRGGRGDVRAALLILLAESPFNGYQLIHQIDERSGGIWQPSPGSVYPALQLLEDEGLVRSEESEGRRLFHLTDAGCSYVEERREDLNAAWNSVTGAMDETMLELRGLFDQVGIALKQVVHVGTPEQIAEARKLLATTRRQLYRILADEPARGEGV